MTLATMAVDWLTTLILGTAGSAAVHWGERCWLGRRIVPGSSALDPYRDALRHPLPISISPDRIVVSSAVAAAIEATVWAGRVWVAPDARPATVTDAHNALCRAAIQLAEHHAEVRAALVGVGCAAMAAGCVGLVPVPAAGALACASLAALAVGQRWSDGRADAAVARWGDPVRFCAVLEAQPVAQGSRSGWGAWRAATPSPAARARRIRRLAMRWGRWPAPSAAADWSDWLEALRPSPCAAVRVRFGAWWRRTGHPRSWWRWLLPRRYPSLYRYLGWNDPHQSALAFGFEHDNGWGIILMRLSQQLEAFAPGAIRVRQVKEKFGALRVYYDTAPLPNWIRERVAKTVAEAEQQSTRTCEVCGRPGWLRSRRGSLWYRTLCRRCADRLHYGPPLLPGTRVVSRLTTLLGRPEQWP